MIFGYAERWPRLSLVLIIKNETRCLARCLQSVRSIADEIVVVDTGSTDDTVRIAREFGARIDSFEWVDDFAAARNFALEKATGDWILALEDKKTTKPGQCQSAGRDRNPGLGTAYWSSFSAD